MELPINPRLVGIGGPVEGGIFALGDDEITVGRHASNRLPIDDPSLSRRHCAIRKVAAERFEIIDLGSRNGTAVNGLPVAQRALGHGDEIRIGDCSFLFLLSEFAGLPTPVPIEFDDADLNTATFRNLRREDGRLSLKHLLDEPVADSRLSGSLATLMKISTEIHMARGSREIASQLLERSFDAIPAERGAVLLFEGAGEDPSFAYSLDREGGSNVTVHAFSAIIERSRREGVAILAGGGLPDGSGRALAAPLVCLDRTLGVIYLETSDTNVTFDDEHLKLAAAIGGIAGMPFENARRIEWLEAENRRLQEARQIEHDMIGACAPMRDVFQFVAKVAPTASTVLIRGESGTGKELVARAIHRNSPRAGQPFVAINCATLTESLLESELFGHERGAFTGAVVRKPGKLEIADHGTVFLDEVGELPPALQSKLLRVLQEREFERVGGTRPIRVDIRLIAATNRDLETAIAGGTFRQDLYYRLNVVSLAIPPLRERRQDIPLLARHFAAEHAKRAKRRLAGLSPEAVACLEAYDWPGNVRELENALERAVVLGTTDLIIPEDLPEAVLDTGTAASTPSGGYYQIVREEKKRVLLAALDRSGGNYTEAAKELGIHPNYLHRLVRNLDLKRKSTHLQD